MFQIAVHLQGNNNAHTGQLGHRSRIGVLDRVIQHGKNKSACWFATLEQVARRGKEQAG